MLIGLTYDLKSDVVPDSTKPDDWLEEFDSPATIQALAAAIRSAGHDTVELGDGRTLVEKLLARKPDLVFNIAEGVGVGRSREARVPAVLEMLGVPYSGSDPLTMAASLDKDVARRLFASHGVNIPRGAVIDSDDLSAVVALPFPVIVKPAWEGSSKGIREKCLVQEPADLPAVVSELRRDYQQPLLAEEFIEGDELTVGVLGNGPSARVLGIMRVVPQTKSKNFVYSLEVKRNYQEHVKYEVPAKLPADVVRRVETQVLSAYRALGCRDVSRIDVRLRNGEPFVLEANPLPGLSPETGDLVLIANGMGLTHTQLVLAILNAAIARHRL